MAIPANRFGPYSFLWCCKDPAPCRSRELLKPHARLKNIGAPSFEL